MKLHTPDLTGNHFCGPGALSIISGKPAADIARLVRLMRGNSRPVKFMYANEMPGILKTLGYRTHCPNIRNADGKSPTLTQWLKAMRADRTAGRVFLILAGHHFFVISGRRYVDNMTKEPISILDKRVKRRARVYAAWEVTKE